MSMFAASEESADLRYAECSVALDLLADDLLEALLAIRQALHEGDHRLDLCHFEAARMQLDLHVGEDFAQLVARVLQAEPPRPRLIVGVERLDLLQVLAAVGGAVEGRVRPHE